MVTQFSTPLPNAVPWLPRAPRVTAPQGTQWTCHSPAPQFLFVWPGPHPLPNHEPKETLSLDAAAGAGPARAVAPLAQSRPGRRPGCIVLTSLGSQLSPSMGAPRLAPGVCEQLLPGPSHRALLRTRPRTSVITSVLISGAHLFSVFPCVRFSRGAEGAAEGPGGRGRWGPAVQPPTVPTGRCQVQGSPAGREEISSHALLYLQSLCPDPLTASEVLLKQEGAGLLPTPPLL